MLEGILNVFRALLAPVIAGVVAYIAYQQHKTNRDKLRLDLYNKRYEVFRGLMIFITRILQQAKIELEQVGEFSRATKEAVFLFDEGIETYLETIRKKANDLWATEETMKDLPKGDERSAKAAEASELLRWFVKQSCVAVDKFGKYLKFEQKLEGKAMNWKRGFRRIAFVSALVVAIVCAIFSAAIIMEMHDDAKSNLVWNHQQYEKQYQHIENLPDGFILDLDAESVSKLRAEGLSDKEIQDYTTKQTAKLKAEQIEAKRKIIKEKKSFWLRNYGLCGVGGLIGGIIGFVVVWFICKMLEWLVVGFCADSPKDKQTSK